MSIPSEQALWKMGISADEWLAEHDKQVREKTINEFLAECKKRIEEIALEIEDDLTFLDIIDIQKVAEKLKEKNK